MEQITRAELNRLKDKNIKEICPNGYIDNTVNHCAHFVSHVLSYNVGYTCNNLSSGAKGVCVRVQDLFKFCPEVGRWEDDKTDAPRLVFVTALRNVSLKDKKMANVGKKHVGIYLGAAAGEDEGLIWHYLNSEDKVVRWPVEQFEEYFKKKYEKSATLFYGVFLV